MENLYIKACEIQNFLAEKGIQTNVTTENEGVYTIYTNAWHYDIYCEIKKDSDNFTLETFNMNIGEFGNLATRKTLKAVYTYFDKFITKAWNW